MENKNVSSEQIIKKEGLRLTESRKSILDTLIIAKEPLSIEVIKSHLKNKVDIVTIYRTLKAFVEKGLVYQTDFRDGKSYFEYQHSHHHHLVCTSCGLRESIKECRTVSEYGNILESSKSFSSVKSHALEFFGVCNKCQS